MHGPAADAVELLQRRWRGLQPRTLIGLGSGLGDVCREMTVEDEIGFDAIPGFAPPTVAGHAGRLRVGTWSGRSVVVMLGRMHLYEGHSTERVVHPIHVAAGLGVRRVVLTNMSGGLPSDWTPPALALVDGHRDLQEGWLVGFAENVARPYSESLSETMVEAAETVSVPLQHGIYAGLIGPCYETPAEIRALRELGCDMVGMSTVKEARTAHEMGLECCAVSCVANYAAGVTGWEITHGEVVDAGRKVAPALKALLGAFLKRLRESTKE